MEITSNFSSTGWLCYISVNQTLVEMGNAPKLYMYWLGNGSLDKKDNTRVNIVLNTGLNTGVHT